MDSVEASPLSAPLDPGAITNLLHRWSGGERAALDRLVPVIYEELRKVARSLVRREHSDNTLQATGLVHEAFIRLSHRQTAHWRSRGEFFAWAATVMRHVLVDHARARRTAKRGGKSEHVNLDDHEAGVSRVLLTNDSWIELAALDDALRKLERLDPQQAKIVELRFFGDLGVEEAAEALGISAATVKRDWSTARAWLLRELRHSRLQAVCITRTGHSSALSANRQGTGT
jgi:RNA polymerase sigma factor (TIGR02999 family)